MSGSAKKSIKRKFKWIIDGITREKLELPGFSLYSDQVFIDFAGNKTEWRGKIKQSDQGYLRVGLHLSKAVGDDFTHFLTIALHDIKKESKGRALPLEVGHSDGWSHFITIAALFDPSKKYLQNSRMEFDFEIEIIYKDPTDDNLMTALLKRNSSYYSDATFTDFILKSSDGEEFKVHRMVLAYESDFFMKMFTTDMQEKEKGYVQFEDIDSATLKEVVSYIYTLDTEVDDIELASKVIDAAEKLNLRGLKAICGKKLGEKVCKDNAIEILAIADLYNDKDLEEVCLNIIMANYAAVKRSDAWKSLTFPLLLKITDAMDTAQTTLMSTL